MLFFPKRDFPFPHSKGKTKRIIIMDFFQNSHSIFEISNPEYVILIRFKFSLVV